MMRSVGASGNLYVSPLGHEWVAFGMREHLERQVNVERGPVEVVVAFELHVEHVLDGGMFEPREFLEGQEVFLVVDEQP